LGAKKAGLNGQQITNFSNGFNLRKVQFAELANEQADACEPQLLLRQI
jgi:hypothetical protein